MLKSKYCFILVPGMTKTKEKLELKMVKTKNRNLNESIL